MMNKFSNGHEIIQMEIQSDRTVHVVVKGFTSSFLVFKGSHFVIFVIALVHVFIVLHFTILLYTKQPQCQFETIRLIIKHVISSIACGTYTIFKRILGTLFHFT